jgi:hypothetical protein
LAANRCSIKRGDGAAITAVSILVGHFRGQPHRCGCSVRQSPSRRNPNNRKRNVLYEAFGLYSEADHPLLHRRPAGMAFTFLFIDQIVKSYTRLRAKMLPIGRNR